MEHRDQFFSMNWSSFQHRFYFCGGEEHIMVNEIVELHLQRANEAFLEPQQPLLKAFLLCAEVRLSFAQWGQLDEFRTFDWDTLSIPLLLATPPYVNSLATGCI
jgi:hypothetical protein